MFPVVDRRVAPVLTAAEAAFSAPRDTAIGAKDYKSARIPRDWLQFRTMADKKLEHLSQVKMFSSLNKKELGLVAKASDVINVPAGTDIVKEGQIGHEFYLISSGSAVVKRNGRKVINLGPGHYFGEMALLDRGPRTATVTAEEPTELIVLGQREFMAVLDQVPPVAHKLLVSMAGRLREADSKAVSH